MSLADELSQLQKLKDSGVLSESEFQAAKSKLLGAAASSPALSPPAAPAKPSGNDAVTVNSVLQIVGMAAVAVAILLGGVFAYGSYIQARQRHAEEAAEAKLREAQQATDALLAQQVRAAEAKKAAENARRAVELTKALNRCTREWNRQIGDVNAKATAETAQFESRGLIGKMWHANQAGNDLDLMKREAEQYKTQRADCEAQAHQQYDPLP